MHAHFVSELLMESAVVHMPEDASIDSLGGLYIDK